MTTRASIVINTYNRAESLERTLQSLRYLDYPDFEVVVVNGPSDDDTEELLKKWQDDVKVGYCPERNLSVSRNIGTAMAAGEVVAFIDDDAVPEPEWLSRIMAGYDSDEVGGVGGSTYDHTGHDFQARYIIRDRFGGARFVEDENPTPYYNFPNAREFCGFLGTNASFRRDVLLQIGGFDEEYEYWGDETDVCVRLIDSGRIARFVDDAFVQHKFLPSHVRNTHGVFTNWYPVIKNEVYFALKNASHMYSLREITAEVVCFIDHQRAQVREAIDKELADEGLLHDFGRVADIAMRDGFARGLGSARHLISQETLDMHAQPFKRFSAQPHNS